MTRDPGVMTSAGWSPGAGEPMTAEKRGGGRRGACRPVGERT